MIGEIVPSLSVIQYLKVLLATVLTIIEDSELRSWLIEA